MDDCEGAVEGTGLRPTLRIGKRVGAGMHRNTTSQEMRNEFALLMHPLVTLVDCDTPHTMGTPGFWETSPTMSSNQVTWGRADWETLLGLVTCQLCGKLSVVR